MSKKCKTLSPIVQEESVFVMNIFGVKDFCEVSKSFSGMIIMKVSLRRKKWDAAGHNAILP
jgi:hypothetical protein